jgi:hypothetical protein
MRTLRKAVMKKPKNGSDEIDKEKPKPPDP